MGLRLNKQYVLEEWCDYGFLVLYTLWTGLGLLPNFYDGVHKPMPAVSVDYSFLSNKQMQQSAGLSMNLIVLIALNIKHLKTHSGHGWLFFIGYKKHRLL